MKNEFIGILLLFLVIIITLSFLSYSPYDPSIHHAALEAGKIHNLFGKIGANLAGFFIGLFGLGAFWIPVLLTITCLHYFRQHPPKSYAYTCSGGLFLITATSGLFALFNPSYTLFGRSYTAGGLVGFPLRTLLLNYANFTGAILILSMIFILSFMLAMEFSMLAFCRKLMHFSLLALLWLRRNGTLIFSRIKVLPSPIVKTRSAPPKALPAPSPAAGAKEKRKTPSPKSPPNSSKSDIIIKDRVEVSENNVFEPAANALKPNPSCEVQRPSVDFLDIPKIKINTINKDNLRMQADLLESKLEDFNIKGEIVEISPGPVITTFEYKPAPGVKISKIVNLADDLALALSAMSIRIVAPIPGKDVIGIEVPNEEREFVYLKEIIASQSFANSKSSLTLCLGKDIVGKPVTATMDKMPHLLIAGATGTGKSVGLNAMITSLLYKSTPDEVKLLMIDPKRIELSAYDGIPHLIAPVVTDMTKATNALYWAVREMERRYELLAQFKVRNIQQFNEQIAAKESAPAPLPDPTAPPPIGGAASAEVSDEPPERLPFIVIIIDELADLMMVASKEVEVALTRLAQMARAAGLHLILATQRPSVDVLTGIIKANFPTRMSFQVSSRTDSRTIIDSNGAENLLGSGDMLFLPPGTARLQRIHGAYISEKELTRITDFLKSQKQPDYIEDITAEQSKDPVAIQETEDIQDEKYDEAIALVTQTRQASISMVQRHLRIGYNRAARIIEMMEKEGVIGPSDGVKPREVLVRDYDDFNQ